MSRRTKPEVAKPESEEVSAESEEDQEPVVAKVQGSESEDASAESESEVKVAKKSNKRKKDKDKDDDADGTAAKKKRKRRNPLDAQHPPTTEMVLDALLALDEKKGTTIAAMKNFITAENTVRPEKLSHLMRQALRKLLDKEKIIRPKGEENKSIMVGRYKIAPQPRKDELQANRPASLRALRNTPVKKKKKKRRHW